MDDRYRNLDFLRFPNYNIDTCGSVWSKNIYNKNEWKKLKSSKNQQGYLCVNLWNKGKCKKYTTHTLVLYAFVSLKPKNQECRHLNGIKNDNRLENLKWGTRTENIQDNILHGIHPTGENHVNSKLTKVQVAEIRKRYKTTNITQTKLAEEYQVCIKSISNVVNYNTWNYI